MTSCDGVGLAKEKIGQGRNRYIHLYSHLKISSLSKRGFRSIKMGD